MPNLGADLKTLPATPIVGNVLVRGCVQGSIQAVLTDLDATHRHQRGISVPINLPNSYFRHLKSGSSRASGPRDDSDRSGVDFFLRMIGRRAVKKATAAKAESEGSESDEAADEAGGSAEGTSQLNAEFLRGCDPALMDAEQLKHIFGDRAQEMQSVIFQHTSKITGEAEYLPPDRMSKVALTERGAPRDYRKSQVSESVYIKALQSALNTSNVPLSSNECLVCLCGGTPEVVLAGIVVGYHNVIYVAQDENERNAMCAHEDDTAKAGSPCLMGAEDRLVDQDILEILGIPGARCCRMQ